MARIRTIKPEFWDSPDTAKASPPARLLYIAMWNWADDWGRGTANLKEIEGFAFPNDDLNALAVLMDAAGSSAGSEGSSEIFRRLVKEVFECFGVVYYEVRGRRYYLIPKFHDHQRTERNAKPKFPGPEDGETLEITRIWDGVKPQRRKSSEVPPGSEGSSVLGTGEQGNRGTGEILLASQRQVTSATAKTIAPRHLATKLVNGWLDHQPQRPPTKVVNDATTQVQALVNDGIPPEQIAAGLTEWWAGKYPASTIPNYVARANQPRQARQATGTQRAAETLDLARQLELEEQDRP